VSFFGKTRNHRRAARPAPTQLKVEQLEDRSVPSGTSLCHIAAVHPGGACFEQASHAPACPQGHDHGHHGHHHHGGGGTHGHPKHNVGSISGTILNDSTGTALTGVTVTVSVLNSTGGVVATTTTSSGVYSFTGLAVAGGSGSTYTVVQTTLSNYTLDTSPQTVTLTQSTPQVQNVNFGNTPNGGGIIA
jgi:hypothetical protein